MQLDHDTGALDGEVLEGRLAGRRLSSLDGDERRELLAQVADDPASLQVLEAWIERDGGAETGTGAAGGPSGGPAAGASDDGTMRSEERRVGKEGVSTVRYRWSPFHSNKNKKEQQIRTHTEHT